MSPFRRLTGAEARTIIPGELLDRVKAEENYWHRSRPATVKGQAAEREFRSLR